VDCHHCGKHGYIAAACRAKKAGKPLFKRTYPPRETGQAKDPNYYIAALQNEDSLPGREGGVLAPFFIRGAEPPTFLLYFLENMYLTLYAFNLKRSKFLDTSTFNFFLMNLHISITSLVRV